MGRFSSLGRVLRTGIAFSAFGVGALILAGIVFPVAHRSARTRTHGELRVQRIIQRSFRAFAALMSRLGLIDVTFEGERLEAAEPTVVVANHPTLIDVVLLVSRMPQVDCVVKQEAWSNPFLRGVVSAAGYVPNAGGMDLIDACADRLRAGRSILLFPEGTRSPKGSLGPYRRGAAHVALRAGSPLRRVVIRCDPPCLSKEEKWWQVPERTPKYHISVHAARVLDRAGAPTSRVVREATNSMREWYLKDLSRERWFHDGS